MHIREKILGNNFFKELQYWILKQKHLKITTKMNIIEYKWITKALKNRLLFTARKHLENTCNK